MLDGLPSTDLIADADFRQRFPLIPDIAYVIDNMCHQDDYLDFGHTIALTIYTPRTPIMALIDDDMDGQWKKREARANALMDLAAETIRTLPPHVIGGIAYASLQWIDKHVNSYVNFIASWSYQDATVGGATKAFIRPARLDHDAMPFKRTARRLRSPAFVKRSVQAEPSVAQFRAHVDRIRSLVALVPSHLIVDRFELFSDEMQAQRDTVKIETAKRFAELYADMRDQRDDQSDKVLVKLKPYWKRKRRIQRDRAVIKRGLRTASQFLPSQHLAAFAKGKPVIMQGAHVDLMVQARGSLADRGHGVIDLSAVKVDATSGTIEKLADLCFYVDDTPAIDQLTAIALNLQSGDETEIINTANVTLLLPAGKEIALLADRARDGALRVRAANPDNWTTVNGGRFSNRDNREYQRRNENAYVDNTRMLWRERIEVETMGRWQKQFHVLMSQRVPSQSSISQQPILTTN